MNEIPRPEIPLPDFLINSPLLNPPPDDPLQQVHRYAYDLAWGALRKLWGSQNMSIALHLSRPLSDLYSEHKSSVTRTSLSAYVFHVWFRYGIEPPPFELLETFGYMRRPNSFGTELTPQCYALLDKPHPHSIFISYRRSTSSSIAMLIWSELRAGGYNTFLDVNNIAPGDVWHSLLEQRVQTCTVFIPIITFGTSESEAVKKEIEWALSDATKHRIIPVLHNKFTADDLRLSENPFNRLANYNFVPTGEDMASELYGMIEQIKFILGR